MKFRELKIIDPILKALERAGYQEPSPIQEKAIPPALLGRDVLGCAQTGTGKTAAFAVPILQLLNQTPAADGRQRKIRSLILTPTRELALQIYESFSSYGCNLPLRCQVVFGGVSQVPQVEKLKKGVDILVATPGRLNDLIQQKIIDLSFVEIFVLDEADRMLDMGFIHDVKKVIGFLPEKKQTLFFSATMPPEIISLVNSLLKNPARVTVTPVSSTVDAIEQRAYFVDKGNKPKLLLYLLKDPKIVSALVFTRTKHGADKVARVLSQNRVRAMAIHGNKSQSARQQALSEFKSGKIRVLVATDIAARGIDIEELSHVVNYDLPNVPETYVHRIGRTGRAGLSGVAISFCNIDEKPYLAEIEKLIKKEIPIVQEHPYPMQVFDLTPPAQHNARPQQRQANPHVKKERGGKKENFPSVPVKKKESGLEKTQKKQWGEKKRTIAEVKPATAEKKIKSHAQGTKRDSKPFIPQEKPLSKEPAQETKPAVQYLKGVGENYTKPPRRTEGPKPLLQRTAQLKKPVDQFLTNKKPLLPRKG